MSPLLVTHSACLEHLTPLGHPERPDRLRAIERVLEHERFMPLAREHAPRAVAETIALCHPPEYIEQIRDAVPQEGLVRLAADTAMSSRSFEAPTRAGGRATPPGAEGKGEKGANAVLAHCPPG